MHIGIAGVLLERNDLSGAREHLAISHRLGEHNGLPQNPYRRRLVMARMREVEGDLDDALALLDDAERVYAGDYAPNVQPVPAVRARLRLRRGELAHAEEWARQRQLTSEDGPSYLREYEHLTLARLLIARHRVEPDAREHGNALTHLARLLAAAERGGRGASVMEVLVLQALAHEAGRNMPAALAALHRAVTLAQPEGYVRLFAEEGAPMAALLKTLRKQPAAPAYVNRLLAVTARTGTRASTPQELVEPLSERELDVLRLLGSDLGGPDIARELSVSLNTLRTHTKSIYAKLGVTSRRAAVSQARELNLIRGRGHN
jgi:LuxR family maltose regulon positive regulatory protein